MKKQILLTIGLATLLVPSTQASQEQLATSIRDTRLETTRTSEQLKATVQALNALTSQKKGDLRPVYDAFCAEVTKTQAAADWTAARVKWMDGDAQAYFKDWQSTITTIANESLRKKSQKRLETVRSGFDKVKVELQEASQKFKPLLSDLGDIQKTLAADVTAAGVKAIRGTVRSANTDSESVQDAINSALKEMAKLEKELSPEAK